MSASSPVRQPLQDVPLRRRGDIGAVLKGGRRLVGRRMVVYVLPRPEGVRRGFVCGRGIGNAVVRNRARRLLREAWRALEGTPRRGCDVVFVARPEIRGTGMRDVMTDMARTLSAAGVLAR